MVGLLGLSAPALAEPLDAVKAEESAELPKVRHVALLPTVGVWRHGFRGKEVEAELGPVWGMFARVEPWRFLNVRVGVMRGNQPVRVTAGALGAPELGVDQPPLQILRFVARVEPTLSLAPALDAYLGVGLGWSRSVAPELETTGPRLESAPRTSVALVPELTLGMAYEPIVDWLLITAELGGSWLVSQSGSALGPIQAFSPDGHRTELGGLPRFAECLEVLVGVGLVL